MLNYFVRNLTYFQTVRNNRELNTGYIYDNEFTKLENYINDKILPTIDNLKAKRIHGTLNSDGYLLRNIGNKLTAYSRIRNSDIPDNTIEFDKLSKIIKNSIVGSNAVNLYNIPCTVLNSTLVNDIDNCSFQKIITDNIANNSISSAKIALKTLTLNHLSIEAINHIVNGVITNSKILDGAINEFKLSNKSVTDIKLREDTINLRNNLNLTFIRQNVTGLLNDTHIVKTDHIGTNSINFKHLFQNNRVLQNSCIAQRTIQAYNNSDINPYSIFYGNPITNEYIKDRSFSFRAIKDQTQGITKLKLSNEVKQRLVAGGLVV
jgi:hypothetical protein